MIDLFESTAQLRPNQVFLSFVNKRGEEKTYTYRQVRLMAAQLARRLREKGVLPGDVVAVDLPNCPMYVFLVLAAAYGSFGLVALNHRLTSSEKMMRLMELERCGMRCALQVDEEAAQRLFDQVRVSLTRGESPLRRVDDSLGGSMEDAIHFAEHASHTFDAERRALVMFTSGTTGKPKAAELTWRNLIEASQASNRVLSGRNRGRGMWQAVLPFFHVGGFQVLVRSVCSRWPVRVYERFDAAKVLADAQAFHVTHISVVDKMLQDLLDAEDARGAADRVLHQYDCILLGGGPLNARTIGRSLAARARIYASYGMTETSSQVANELVTADFTGGMKLLPGYSARIVEPNAEGFGRLALRGPGVFGGYANARAAFTVDGFFLTGDTAAFYEGKLYVRERTADMFVSGGENVYPAEIVDALVRVPGVSDAYVFGVPDARWGRRPVAIVERAAQMRAASAARAGAAYGSDGARLGTAGDLNGAQLSAAGGSAGTQGGSTAAGGSNPADARSGATSTAIQGAAAQRAIVQPPTLTADAIRQVLSERLSRVYVPERICLVDELPRSGIGKIDRLACERLYHHRIQIERVVLHRVRLPFSTPFRTPKETLTYRDSLIVEVVDHQGRVGLGECTSFDTDWYLPETLDEDIAVLREVLAPRVRSATYLHPREVSVDFASISDLARYPMACSAIEMACWDLYGKITARPLWQMLGEEFDRLTEIDMAAGRTGARRAVGTASVPGSRPAKRRVYSGAVVGLGTPAQTVEDVRDCVKQGYQRIKLKVAPNKGLAAVRAVRRAFPRLLITLDANQSFSLHHMAELRAYDQLDIGWIEEPLDLSKAGVRNREGSFERLASFQHTLAMPICLDESFVNAQEAERMFDYPELRCAMVKIGKFGGIEPSLKFVHKALSLGREVCMSGMYDTGVSRFAHAAFQTLPGVVIPGDLGATARYFDQDLTVPAYEAPQGIITLNAAGHEYGIGCALALPALTESRISRIVIG